MNKAYTMLEDSHIGSLSNILTIITGDKNRIHKVKMSRIKIVNMK